MQVIHITSKGAALRDVGDSLEDHQSLVGGRVECIALSERIDLWCNEEGKLDSLPTVAALLDDTQHVVDLIAGPCFLASHDDEGNTTGLDGALLDEARAVMARHLVVLPAF